MNVYHPCGKDDERHPNFAGNHLNGCNRYRPRACVEVSTRTRIFAVPLELKRNPCVGWKANPFPNFTDSAMEVWELISNLFPQFTGHVITYLFVKLTHVSRKGSHVYTDKVRGVGDEFRHDDVIKWKHFPRNWPFVRGIHRSRWIPHTKASDAELWCFLWSASE